MILPPGWVFECPPPDPSNPAQTKVPQDPATAALESLQRAAKAHSQAVERASASGGQEVPAWRVTDVLNAGTALDVAVSHALKYHSPEEVAAVEGLHPSYIAEIQRGAPIF